LHYGQARVHDTSSHSWVRVRSILDYLGLGTVGCRSSSRLAFVNTSSPTNIHTHSS